MEIKVIIPNAGMDETTLQQREKMLSVVLRTSTEVTVDCIKAGPVSLTSHYDDFQAGKHIINQAKEAEVEGFDAIVLYCGCDPALDAVKEVVEIPVVGPGEASIHFASMLSRRFSILFTTITGCEDQFHSTKLDSSFLASIRTLEMPVVELKDESGVVKEAKDIVSKEATKAIEEDGAQAIILGCLGLAGIGKEMSQQLGVPVIDPALLAVSIAEQMCILGLSHSKLSWPYPKDKKYYPENG